ncbi:CHAT domain-containing protein [Nonomuraea typhae]|uniref:CHAT domain-containing protein n=1 Tax=Nonomuraea typhae TaxID=2603600 RepID=UPI0012F84928|nr:CHAT domain-containing protein [Nonomuraea typhae]
MTGGLAARPADSWRGGSLGRDAHDPARMPEEPLVPESAVTPVAETLTRFTADPRRRMPGDTARLDVQRDGDGFLVMGAHREILLPRTGNRRYGRPKLGLGALTDDGDSALDPREIRYRMREWSRTHDEIGDWINELRGHVGDAGLALVIVDDTGFEIPWELLWLPEDPGGELRPGWMGALIKVARWTTIHRDGRDPSGDEPEDCAGEVVAFLGAGMEGDFAALSRFTERPYQDLPAFLARLRSERGGLGLVYMACHGRYGTTTSRLELGGLRVRDLQAPLPAIRDSHSLVFMNACHSARLVNDLDLGDSILRGFAESFLRHGAAAVIGTVGRIGTAYAMKTACSILDELAGDQDRPVSEALRDLRARIDSQTPDEPEDPRELLEFLYAFMYLYFGNPHTRLRLRERGHD